MGCRLLLVLILLVMLINYFYDLVSVRACVCVNLRGAGVDIQYSSLPCVGKPPMVVVTVQGAPRTYIVWERKTSGSIT